MDLSLDDEQRMLAETARAFVDRSCPPEVARALDAGAPEPQLWPIIAGAGWPGLVIPEAHEGAGRGMAEVVVVCEQLGRGPVPTPLVATTALAALPILWLGTDEQRRRWLPGLARGTSVGTLALLEPGMRDEWDAVRIPAAPRVSGTKILVPWAAAATLMVVATAAGLRIVEPASPAVRASVHDSLGGDPLSRVVFDDADSEPLGRADDGRATLDRALDHAAIAQLACAVGAAERALELSVQHAKDRHQFGRPIGSFQAVAHRCADMRADIDACRYLAYRAAWALDRGDGGADAAAAAVAAAKAYANDAMRRIFRNAHQVHGAIGFSTEYDLHLFTRRAKAFELSYGGGARHRERLADAMGLESRP
jgi:alkylation response protein AidB-like acyl-CoA dehydrogenase